MSRELGMYKVGFIWWIIRGLENGFSSVMVGVLRNYKKRM